MTQVAVDVVTGDKYQAARMPVDDLGKFPPDNNPAFALVYRADEGGDWPTYNITSNQKREVGKIA
jgi:hypothetical protein